MNTEVREREEGGAPDSSAEISLQIMEMPKPEQISTLQLVEEQAEIF